MRFTGKRRKIGGSFLLAVGFRDSASQKNSGEERSPESRRALLLRLYGFQHHQAHLAILIVELNRQHAVRIDRVIADAKLRL
jgi:hypothetical protein